MPSQAARWGLGLTALLCALLPPAWAADVQVPLGNGYAATLDARGVLSIQKDGTPVLREAFLGVWDGDQFSDQFRATKTEGAERAGTLVRRGVIPTAAKTRYDVFLRASPPASDGLRDLLVTYVAENPSFPKSRAAVLMRLPLAPYANKSVRVGSTDAGVFPEKPAQNHVLASPKDAHDFLVSGGGKPLLAVSRQDPGEILVQDARKWGTDAYEAQFQLMPTRSQPETVRAIHLLISLGGTRGPTMITLDTNRPPAKEGMAPALPRFALLEISLDLWAPFNNPYDADDIEIAAVFAQPDKTTRTIRGFYYQAFERELSAGKEKLTPVGPTQWRIRFAPTQTGLHSFVVTARTRTGTLQTKPATFQVAESDAPGFVSVSPRDHRYFQFTNGTTFFPVGHNICWGSEEKLSYDYDSYFRRMGNAAENYTRLWMCSWDTGIEGSRLDNYRLAAAWRLDYILQLAEQRGIYVKLCFDNEHDYNNAEKRKLFGCWKENGGPCASVLDVFTDPAAKGAYKRRLDYILARWGYSPNILAWELWNEMNYIASTDPKARQILVQWTAEVARYLKEHDPHNHLVTTSLGLLTVWDELWQIPEIDFAQVHAYLPQPDSAKEEDEKDEVLAVLRAGERIARFDKPYYISEFGYLDLHEVNRTNERDATGIHLHNAIWGSLFSGAAGTPAVWWWKYIHDRNLYCHYASAARFLHGLDLADKAWRQLIATSLNVRVLGIKKPDGAALWIQQRGNNWYRRIAEGKPLEPLGKVKVRVPDLEKGKYRVTWWDTSGGEITNYPQLAVPSATKPGRFELVLEHNSGAADIAVKVEKTK